jgi:hypothetical protein
VGLVRTDVAEKHVSFIFKVSKRLTIFSLIYFYILKMEAARSYETSVLIRCRHIAEDCIHQVRLLFVVSYITHKLNKDMYIVGPLSLVSTTEELLDRKVAAPV